MAFAEKRCCVLMAVLASSEIPHGERVRLVMPPIAMWFVICIAALIIGVWVHWGPFRKRGRSKSQTRILA